MVVVVVVVVEEEVVAAAAAAVCIKVYKMNANCEWFLLLHIGTNVRCYLRCMYVCMYIKGKLTHKSVAVFIYFMKHVVPLFAAEVDTQLTHEVFELDTTKTERS